MVQVGIDDLLNVTVSVENSEENAYNSRVILTYPVGLSYRIFSAVQVSVLQYRLWSAALSGHTAILVDAFFFK